MTDARCVVCKLPIRYVPKWNMWTHQRRAKPRRVWLYDKWEIVAGYHDHEARPESVSERKGVTLPPRGPDGRFLSGSCENDCQKRCAYPGQFSECDLGAQEVAKSAVSEREDVT